MSNAKYQMSNGNKLKKNNSISIGYWILDIGYLTFSRGFTLIELLLAFALIVTISIIATASYSQFTNFQRFNNSVRDVGLTLQAAKSRTQSQVKPTNIPACQTTSLSGYEVHICGYPGASCSTSGQYRLLINCSGTTAVMQTKQLPSGISFSTGTAGRFFFQVLSGAVQAGNITLSGFNKSKTIVVSSTGNITVP